MLGAYPDISKQLSERDDFLRHNNMVTDLRHDPGTLGIIPRAGSFQGLRQRLMQWGLSEHNSKGTCRSTHAEEILLWLRKSPGALKRFLSIYILWKFLIIHFLVIPRLDRGIHITDFFWIPFFNIEGMTVLRFCLNY